MKYWKRRISKSFAWIHNEIIPWKPRSYWKTKTVDKITFSRQDYGNYFQPILTRIRLRTGWLLAQCVIVGQIKLCFCWWYVCQRYQIKQHQQIKSDRSANDFVKFTEIMIIIIMSNLPCGNRTIVFVFIKNLFEFIHVVGFGYQ